MPQIDIKLQTKADTTGFTQTSAAANDLGRTVGDLGTRMEHMFTGRHAATAIATALGLTLDKIAEHIARLATSMSEAEEEAYKKLESLRDKAADLAIKNMRSRR